MPKLALLGGKPVFKKSHKWPRWPMASQADEKRVLDVVRRGIWGGLDSSLPWDFARQFGDYLKVKHVLPVGTGTAALELAVKGLGIVPGDEVIVPTYTFVATATCVLQMGATPVFADIDKETFTLDPQDVARRITRRTRAIIPVHFAGNPCHMAEITALAKKHGLLVIEDAAHAHGMFYRGKAAGNLSDVACFSFQSSKNMASGEGGAMATNNQKLYDLAWSFHSFGRLYDRPWYEHHYLSRNDRLTSLQAALLIGQLEQLEPQTKLRLANGNFLNRELARLPGMQPQKTSDSSRGTRRAFHLYMWRMDPNLAGIDRDSVVKALQAEGIPCGGGYPAPLQENPMFLKRRFWHSQYLGGKQRKAGEPDFTKMKTPVAKQLCAEVINFHQAVLLASQAEMQGIVDAVARVLANVDELRQFKKNTGKRS